MRRPLDGGARAAAMTFAQKVLRAEPLRESTVRLLIEIHLAEGAGARRPPAGRRGLSHRRISGLTRRACAGRAQRPVWARAVS